MTEIKELKVEDIKKAAEEKKCRVQQGLYYITEFLAGPMCGRCFPCAFGSYEAKLRLLSIADGKGTENDIVALKLIAEEMAEASMCKKGKDTAAFIAALVTDGAFAEHIAGTCASGQCSAFMEYRIVADNCTACGKCKEVCTHNAVFGEKGKPFVQGYPFEIRRKKCTQCGECIAVCPEKAIIFIGKTSEPVHT